jgi:hypothetical protein
VVEAEQTTSAAPLQPHRSMLSLSLSRITACRICRCVSLWPLLWAWLMIAGLPRNATAQVNAGTLKELRGSASVQRNGSSFEATRGMLIFEGDKLETSRQSVVTIELINGGELILSDACSVIIERPAGTANDSRVELLKGRLRSLINLAAGKVSAFEVHTPNAVASVRGTDFETEYVEGEPCPGFPQCLRYTDIGVYKGIVEVRNPTSLRPISVKVDAGYETTIPCELPPASPGPLGIGDLTAPGYH